MLCWQTESCYFARFLNIVWFGVSSTEERVQKQPGSCEQCYLAVLSKGCWVPISFLTCMATLLNSSLSRQRRLKKEVGYPTIFPASETTLLQSEGPAPENRLSVLCPRPDRAVQNSRHHEAGTIFLSDCNLIFYFETVSSSVIQVLATMFKLYHLIRPITLWHELKTAPHLSYW